ERDRTRSAGSAQDQGGMRSANALGVDKNISDANPSSHVWNVIQIACWITNAIVDRRWDHAVPNGETRGDNLHSAASGHRLATHGFDGRDWNRPGSLSKGELYPGGLRDVVVNKGVTVSAYVVDVLTCEPRIGNCH